MFFFSPGSQTVEETLRFAAELKLDLPSDEVVARVEDLLKLMGLEDCSDIIIGDELKKGISGGQKKRVSAGLELIGNPKIMFLDEPTSGLDSFSSLALIRALKKIAREQNAIVCATIHQPSSELFALFDRVMCLRAGKVLFSGALHGDVIEDLEELIIPSELEGGRREEGFGGRGVDELDTVSEGGESTKTMLPVPSPPSEGRGKNSAAESPDDEQYLDFSNPDIVRRREIRVAEAEARVAEAEAPSAPSPGAFPSPASSALCLPVRSPTSSSGPDDSDVLTEDLLEQQASPNGTSTTASPAEQRPRNRHARLCNIRNVLYHVEYEQPEDFTNVADWLLYLAQTLDGEDLDFAALLTKIFYDYDLTALEEEKLGLEDLDRESDIGAASGSGTGVDDNLGTSSSSSGAAVEGGGGSGTATAPRESPRSDKEFRSFAPKTPRGLAGRLVNGRFVPDREHHFEGEEKSRFSDPSMLGGHGAGDCHHSNGATNGGTGTAKSHSSHSSRGKHPRKNNGDHSDEDDDPRRDDQLTLTPRPQKSYCIQLYWLYRRELQTLRRDKWSLFIRIFIPFVQMSCYGIVYWNACSNLVNGSDNQGNKLVKVQDFAVKLDLVKEIFFFSTPQSGRYRKERKTRVLAAEVFTAGQLLGISNYDHLRRRGFVS